MYNLKLLTHFLTIFLIFSAHLFASIEKNEKKSFNVSFGGELIVDTDKGSIIVETNNSSNIEVELFLTAKTNDDELAEKLFNAFKVTYDHSGSNLKIVGKYNSNKSWFKNLFGGSKSNKLKVKFIISVPKKYSVDLNTSGGGISVGDLEGLVEARTSGGGLTFGNITGNIDGKTSGGGITVGECDGDIKISTSGGGIKIKKCEGTVDAHTSGGGITVNEVYGAIDASTSGGSVYASITEQPKEKCSLTTSGGGITVKLAKNINLYLDAKTSGGSVQTDFPITIKGKVQRSKLSGKINDGGPELYLRSSGGSIHIEEN